MKLLEGNKSINLDQLGLGNTFLDMMTKSTKNQGKIDTSDIIKILKTFVYLKTTKKMRRQPTKWERNLQSMYTIRVCASQNIITQP